MNKYKAIIGLEVHCEISKTNTKVFSSARNSYTNHANVNIRPVDLAFPGTLPVVNKECVKMALMTSMVLNCKVPEYFYFERKNYYYPDLPKGFQITQETKPIPAGSYGYVDYEFNGEVKRVRVNNIHLEEDAASLDHYENQSNIDYNRAGVPLLELVTEPDFRSADEATAFLEHMCMVYRYLKISDADTKKGQVRCDVNVSIMNEELDDTNPNNYGTKVEVKNVNSFGGVRDAINYEIKRQIEAKENGTYDKIEQETRRWDEDAGVTIRMRSKADAIDYKYFVEPNIPKFKLDTKWLEEIKASIPRLHLERKQDYINNLGLSEYDANVIVKDRDFADYFEECVKLGIDAKTACNWLTTQISGVLNKENIDIMNLFVTPKRLFVIIDAVNKGVISSKQAKEVFIKSLEKQIEPNEFISNDNAQISDENVLDEIISKIIENSPNQVAAYHNGRTNLFDYFVGQVMKETKGKANPVKAKEIINKYLN